MKLALGYGAVFILTFLIVFTDRHNTWCEYSQSFYFFCQWSAKIHNQKSENSTHLLPAAVHLVSFEGAVKYNDTYMHVYWQLSEMFHIYMNTAEFFTP